ncbi:MAG: LPP20 family lipoprotein [Phycisphaerae bacterium]|nr:hypothetical protein [Phycisphaerae bacterium]NUQ45700.1 LPP20 family lipoprotein [Phycisphaerae bacterium]
MTRYTRWFAAAVVVAVAVPVQAQVDTADAKKKLLSKRAAEADAYRKLAECIKGLQINSTTYVKDFVAESDEIRTSMDDFIRGVRLGEARWHSDMSCEVPAEVTVAKVIETLKAVHTRHYHGDRVTGRDFEEMQRRVEKQVIRVVGMGAPREDLPPDLPAGVAQQIGAPPVPPDPPIPDLWKRVGAQGRLMAIRAAEVDAKRKLLERIKGLRITSDTIVRDFVAESDQITAQAMGKVVGASIVRTYLHHDEPIAEVTVAVPVESVVEIIKEIHSRSIQGERVKGTDITNVVKQIKTQTFEATGMGIPPQKAIAAYNASAPSPQEQIPPWAAERIEMTGQGVAPDDKAGTPQGKLMAARAAEIDAKRKLGEHIQGLSISSSTLVKDFVAQHDEIRTYMDAILVGAMVERTEFDGDTATVTVSIPGMQIWQIVHERIRVTATRG